MLLNYGVGEDSWESLGLQRDPPGHPKGDQSWVFIGRTMLKLKLQYFDHLMQFAMIPLSLLFLQHQGQESVPFFNIFTCTQIVQFSRSVVSDSLQPHELQHARPPCPSPTPGVHPNSCPLSRWCHSTISCSVVPFSSCPQSLPASGSFSMSQLFAWGGQSIGVSASASVLPVNTQDWSPLGWTGWISLQSKGLSKVLSNTKVQKNHFFSSAFFIVQLSHPYLTTGKTIALTR